jgi:hypothetical protein
MSYVNQTPQEIDRRACIRHVNPGRRGEEAPEAVSTTEQLHTTTVIKQGQRHAEAAQADAAHTQLQPNAAHTHLLRGVPEIIFVLVAVPDTLGATQRHFKSL